MGWGSPLQALLTWPTSHCCLSSLLDLPLLSLVGEVQVSDLSTGLGFLF